MLRTAYRRRRWPAFENDRKMTSLTRAAVLLLAAISQWTAFGVPPNEILTQEELDYCATFRRTAPGSHRDHWRLAPILEKFVKVSYDKPRDNSMFASRRVMKIRNMSKAQLVELLGEPSETIKQKQEQREILRYFLSRSDIDFYLTITVVNGRMADWNILGFS